MNSITKRQLNHCVFSAISNDLTPDEALNSYLLMIVNKGLGENRNWGKKTPLLQEIYDAISNDPAFARIDIEIKKQDSSKYISPTLSITLASGFVINICNRYGSLQAHINNSTRTALGLGGFGIEQISQWLITLKKNALGYVNEFNDILKEAYKKIKGNRMHILAIKAIFRNAMKEYPDLKYGFVEQKRRVRINVQLPNCRLGVHLDAWFGSYKERLPQQITELKKLVDVHSKTTLTDYYICYR